jgi:hypothetical protein
MTPIEYEDIATLRVTPGRKIVLALSRTGPTQPPALSIRRLVNGEDKGSTVVFLRELDALEQAIAHVRRAASAEGWE